jgi:4-hydroxybenzoyl-CoA thioesterase
LLLSRPVFVHERPVRFEDVDAAQIVFFPRVLAYCHEAMAELMARVDGGYAKLVVERRIGLPTVHVDVDFTAPLRFGDVARMEVTVSRIGRSSCTFEMSVSRVRDGAAVARVKLICASTDLSTLRSVALPADVRRVLEAERVTPA